MVLPPRGGTNRGVIGGLTSGGGPRSAPARRLPLRQRCQHSQRSQPAPPPSERTHVALPSKLTQLKGALMHGPAPPRSSAQSTSAEAGIISTRSSHLREEKRGGGFEQGGLGGERRRQRGSGGNCVGLLGRHLNLNRPPRAWDWHGGAALHPRSGRNCPLARRGAALSTSSCIHSATNLQTLLSLSCGAKEGQCSRPGWRLTNPSRGRRLLLVDGVQLEATRYGAALPVAYPWAGAAGVFGGVERVRWRWRRRGSPAGQARPGGRGRQSQFNGS